jgi:hypothetical protein
VNGGPALAVTPAGDAFVVWIEQGLVASAHGNIASGTWEAPVALTAGGAAEGDPVVAVTDAGDAVAAWQWRDRPSGATVVQAAFRPAHGSWGPPSNVSTVSGDVADGPQIGIDGSGNAVALWTGDGGVRSAARPVAAGSWSPPTVLTHGAATGPRLAVDARGDALAAWVDAATKTVDAAVRLPGAWQPALALAPPGESSNPRVALDDTGDGVAFWNAPTDSGVDVRTADLAGDWQPTLANARRPTVRGIPRVGHAVVCDRGAWQGTVPITFAYHWRRNGTSLHGASHATYRIRRGDAGTLLVCRVSATNSARTLAVSSRPVRVRPLK